MHSERIRKKSEERLLKVGFVCIVSSFHNRSGYWLKINLSRLLHRARNPIKYGLQKTSFKARREKKFFFFFVTAHWRRRNLSIVNTSWLPQDQHNGKIKCLLSSFQCNHVGWRVYATVSLNATVTLLLTQDRIIFHVSCRESIFHVEIITHFLALFY